jgi:hypothetical protein
VLAKSSITALNGRIEKLTVLISSPPQRRFTSALKSATSCCTAVKNEIPYAPRNIVVPLGMVIVI